MNTKFLFPFCLILNISFYSQNIKQKDVDSLMSLVYDKNAYSEKGSKEMLRLCTEIFYQSKEINYKEGISKGLSKMAEIYMSEQNYSMSLKKASEGIAFAEKYNYNSSLSSFYLIKGMNYTELGYSKKSKEALYKSLSYLKNISNNNQKETIQLYIFSTMARNIKLENRAYKSDSLLYYLEKGYNIAKGLNKKFSYRNFYLASFSLDLGKEYFNRNNFLKSKEYLSEFNTSMEEEKEKGGYSTYFLIFGNIENKNKNYTKALEYFDKSIQAFQKSKLYPNELIEIYSGKAEAYSGLKDYKNQALYVEKAKKLADSIYSSKIEILNNTLSVEGHNKYGEQLPNTSIRYVLVLIILIITSVIEIFIYRAKGKKKIKDQFMVPVEMNLSNLDTKNIKDLKELIELVKNNDKSFHLEFSKVFPTFNQNLLNINGMLTHSDLEYCALIKLRFDTKEIARYKNVTVNSVVSKKYRIRKKLNISTKDNIYTWILNIN